MIEAPKTDEVYFVVVEYKDMDYAFEIEQSNSFPNYPDALEFYNKAVAKANGEYLVELALEVDLGDDWDCFKLADNYKK